MIRLENGLTPSLAALTYVPYTGAIGNVNLGTNTLSAEQLTSTHDALIYNHLNVGSGATDGLITVSAEGSMNYLTLGANDAGTSDIYSVQQLYFMCGDNDFTFMHNLYTGAYFRINIAGTNPLLTSSTGIFDFDNDNITTTGTLGAGAITGTSFIIGANILDTNEWAFLDGQDQAVKSTSNVTFGTVGAGATTVTALENTINSVTGTTQALAVNKNYLVTGSSLCTLTLPSTASVGQKIEVTSLNTAGYKIAQNANQYIYLGNKTTTVGTGGYITNVNGAVIDTNSSVTLMCVVANNGWIAITPFSFVYV